MLCAQELLAGAELTYTLSVPPEILNPGGDGAQPDGPPTVRLRPLTVRDLQRISRAAKENDQLTATLMVQQALVEPEMTVSQAAALHAGLVQFLLGEVNRISGIGAKSETLNHMAEEPLAKAAYILAREYGWTPDQVNQLTLGQVLLHLQMMRQERDS